MAFFKAQEATQTTLPIEGSVLITVADKDKPSVVLPARLFADLGFKIYTTNGTKAFLEKHGIESEILKKLGHGRPDIVDSIKNREVNLVINTPERERQQGR
jgi:carbamoyl-phosphate synthase large subunit